MITSSRYLKAKRSIDCDENEVRFLRQRKLTISTRSEPIGWFSARVSLQMSIYPDLQVYSPLSITWSEICVYLQLLAWLTVVMLLFVLFCCPLGFKTEQNVDKFGVKPCVIALYFQHVSPNKYLAHVTPNLD